MRQSQIAGERLFVDYAGTTLEVVDGSTGEVMTAQLFVAALGASSYTYAEATWTQGLADWIGSHTRAFAFVGGVTAMVVLRTVQRATSTACKRFAAFLKRSTDTARRKPVQGLAR